MIIVVLDTNVIVSSLLSRKGLPAKILQLVLSDAIRLAYDKIVILK